MKRLLTISLAVVLALGLSTGLLPAEPAMANPGDIYVDDDAPNDPGPSDPTISDPLEDGSAAHPFDKIQEGITAAGPGDIVHVAAGTYYENVTLKSGVIVQGAGASVTTIDGGGSGAVVTANNVDSTAKIDGFTITGLEGIWSHSAASPTITNNIITGNVYGIHNGYSSPTISNNIITGNRHGIVNSYSSPTITNNTITGNDYGIYNYHSSPTVSNSILWDNGQEIYNSNSTPVVTYSDIAGGYTGTGNIDADPMFVNPGAGDYHLQSGSPAIDVGSDAAAIAAGLTTDFEGDPRIWPSGGVVDMGADEYYVSLVLVTIDIKPGSDPNSINPKSRGKIPVSSLPLLTLMPPARWTGLR